MAGRSSDAISRKYLETLHRLGAFGTQTDGQLLEWCVAGCHEAAEAGFAALVERHGPMVLRVCRQILGDPHDAQDAFQATFLVLIRRAGRVRKRDSLASWLYGIAQRVAQRSRADATRRRAHERRGAIMVATRSHASGESPEGCPELHEEVARLPEKYREAVVLCYLKGLTTEAAAHQLGCPRGTVLSRLARARERLRKQLTRRGLALPSGLVAAGLSSGSTQAAIPAELSHSVVRAVVGVAKGKVAAEIVPESVISLAEGVLRMMTRSMLTKVAGALLAVSILAVGMALIVPRTAADSLQDKPDRLEPSAAPAPRDEDAPRAGHGRTGEIIVRAADLAGNRNGEGFTGTVAIDPETANWRTIATGLLPGSGPVSPDGRFLVYSRRGPNLGVDEIGIWIFDTTGEVSPRRIFEQAGEPHWSHEGRQVVIGTTDSAGAGMCETWRVNADGTGRTKLPIPASDLVLDCSHDGTWLATRTLGGEPAHRGRLTLVHPDGTEPRYLTEGSARGELFTIFRISPDGRRVACVEVKTDNAIRKCRLFVVDIDGKNRRDLPVPFDPGTTGVAHWSPDGLRLAVNVLNGRTKLGSIILVDLDGTQLRKLALPPGSWHLMVCDWKLLSPGLRAQNLDELSDEVAKTPRGRYQALLKEVKQAQPFDPQRFLGRFLEIAESAPQDRVAVDALCWIVTFGELGPEFARAIDSLAENHATNQKVGQDAPNVTDKVSPSAERLLRAVIEKTPRRTTKGRTSLALGRYLKRQSELVRLLNEVPEEAKAWEAMFIQSGSSGEQFTLFIQRDPDALMREAQAVLERTIDEFGDVPCEINHTVGQSARSELYEIRSLCVGQPAPEIDGRDTEGNPLKLSDYRGKVVLVSFWADWCRGCRVMHPFERALVERMRGRPFVLLGVNGDDDRDKVRQQIKEQGITWRSWWDERGDDGTSGPIAEQFNVRDWPTLYLLDPRGVIRHKFLGNPGNARLDAAIDALVEGAESETDVSKNDGAE